MEYLIGAIGALAFVMFLAFILEEMDREKADNIDAMMDVDSLFYHIWNGTYKDRVPAWYRVIGHIEATDKWHLMAEAKRRLKVEENKELSESYVDENYNLKLTEGG